MWAVIWSMTLTGFLGPAPLDPPAHSLRWFRKWYRWFNLVFLVLVCFSILFVKQHYVADIPVAIVITEGAMQIGRATRIERIGFAIEERFKRRKDGSV